MESKKTGIKHILVFVFLLMVFISSLLTFVLSFISFCIDDFYSNKLYHHYLVSSMLMIVSFYSAVKSLKKLNNNLEANF